MKMPARVRKHRHSSGLAHVLDWGATCITSLGTWVDLDERKRPKSVPRLADWATPEGWQRGLRPYTESASKLSERTTAGSNGNGDGHNSGERANDRGASIVREIEQMERSAGQAHVSRTTEDGGASVEPQGYSGPGDSAKGTGAHASCGTWPPPTGCERLDRVGPEALTQILRSLRLQSIDRVDNLQTLHEIVLALEAAAARRSGETVEPLPRKKTSPALAALRLSVLIHAHRIVLRRSIVSVVERNPMENGPSNAEQSLPLGGSRRQGSYPRGMRPISRSGNHICSRAFRRLGR